MCAASSIRAMPENEKPPAMRVDIYSSVGPTVIDAAALGGGDDLHASDGGEHRFTAADIHRDLPYALIALAAAASVEDEVARAKLTVF